MFLLQVPMEQHAATRESSAEGVCHATVVKCEENGDRLLIRLCLIVLTRIAVAVNDLDLISVWVFIRVLVQSWRRRATSKMSCHESLWK